MTEEASSLYKPILYFTVNIYKLFLYDINIKKIFIKNIKNFIKFKAYNLYLYNKNVGMYLSFIKRYIPTFFMYKYYF